MRRLARLIALAALVLVPAFAAAQSADTATLLGTVTDQQDAGIPGVSMTARNIDTGLTRTVVSEASGSYRIVALPPGRYELAAELAGFQAQRRQGLTLSAASEHVVNLIMPIAAVREELTVVSEVPIVDTTSSAITSTWNREQIDLLPMIGRSVNSLLSVAPGVTESSDGYAFGGSRGRSNHFLIDGVDNSADISGLSRQATLVDALHEFQVMVNGFKAEYGRSSGGVINVITRSGTNDMTGDVFWLFRNQDMIARNPFATTKDPFQRVHYGGAAGGALRRDRTHYFAAYERQDRDTQSISTFTLPPSKANFSPATREFFRRYTIDPAIFGAGGSQRMVRPEYVDVHKLTVRVDDQLASGQTLTGKVMFERNSEPSGVSGTALDYNGGMAYDRNIFGNAAHKWVLSSGRLNELYVLFGHTFIDQYATFPMPQISVPGWTLGPSTNNPQQRNDNVTQIIDSLTWVRSGGRTGEHAFKLGADVKLFRSDGFFDSNFAGTYTFASLNDFIAGVPIRFTQQRGDSNLKRPNNIYGVYAQDDWRLNEAWTLNLGVRYDYESAKTEALRDVTGEPGPGISEDHNNFAPRAGFVWAPGGSTKHAIHAATGLFYDQIVLNIQGNARFTPPKVQSVQLDNPSFPDPTAGISRTLVPSISIVDPELTTPYNWNTTVGYRRELTSVVGIDASYVHNRAYDQVGIININAGIPGSANISGAGAVRPDPNFVNKSHYTNIGFIRYHALQVEAKKRYSHGFSGALAYTLSKTEDNVFNFLDSMWVPERLDLSTGPGVEDRRHRLTGHAAARLPWDFQLGVLAEFTSARPLDVFAGSRDLNGDAILGDWVHEDICRNIRCPGMRYSRNSVRSMTLDEANALRTVLGLAPILRFDNPRGFKNVDMTLQKSVRFGRHAARFTLEAFDVFNWPVRGMPSGNITSGLFGQITGLDSTRAFSATTRALQVTLQYDF